ncbi:hypothetical protein [Thiothrix nivea]|uniref:Uncharacterized protein n=1 Tax=Thiothrix nivea (strain ATCC 35100 / DSM 5205 / JP2) TaxID=870187 RepID=A0A656HA39_THINJ|nr:hypothetical protein [Thiothrix nivea]EIJ33097.1 hypothetical protein Thini_0449 [Thiothrix nivea DSM 5205]
MALDKHEQIVNPFLNNVPENNLLRVRDAVRTQIMHVGGAEISSRAVVARNDDPRQLVDRFAHDNLSAMEQAGLREAALLVQPWAGHYVTTLMAAGLLGCRYLDFNQSFQGTWEKQFAYIRNHPAEVIVGSGLAGWVSELSPAEKYDALIGDSNYTLTKAMWGEGQKAFDRFGEVPAWFGICHGWSPASFMLPRPQKPVTVLSPENVPITFQPADIKALASLLWAKAAPGVRFIGGRCNLEPPYEYDPDTQRAIQLFNPFVAEDIARQRERYGGGEGEELPEDVPQPGMVPVSLSWEEWDEATNEFHTLGGRLIASECADTNPGAWHLAVINQIGVSQRGMIMDASFSNEVWNQPLQAYRYTYFNPHTLQQTDVLADATVSMADFTSDIFHKFRSAEAVSVVGVIMRVTYAIEPAEVNEPETVEIQYVESPEEIADMRRAWQLADVDYYYDLELDVAGRIIGGEWYTREHPDFLWTPPAGARAASRYEGMASGEWGEGQVMPESWRAAAVRAAGEGVPLAAVVERMIGLANG